MTIASTGGMASGPSAGRRPSMAARASAASASPKSASEAKGPGSWRGGRHLLEEPQQLDRYRHDQRAVLLPGHPVKARAR
jgi:hypothetical protein